MEKANCNYLISKFYFIYSNINKQPEVGMSKSEKLNFGFFLTLIISLCVIVICSISIIVLQLIEQKTGFTSSNLSLTSPCSTYLIQKYNNYYRYILSAQNIGILIALILSIFITIYIVKNQWNRIKEMSCCGSDSQNENKENQKKEQQNQRREQPVINSKPQQQTIIKSETKGQNCLNNKGKLCLVYIFSSLCLLGSGVSFGLYLSNWFDWETCTSIDFLVYIYFSLAGLMFISSIIIQGMILIKIMQLNNQEIQSQQIIQKKQKQNNLHKIKQQNGQLSQMINQTNRALIKPIPVPVDQVIKPIPVPVDQLNNKKSLIQKLEMQQLQQKKYQIKNQSNQNSQKKQLRNQKSAEGNAQSNMSTTNKMNMVNANINNMNKLNSTSNMNNVNTANMTNINNVTNMENMTNLNNMNNMTTLSTTKNINNMNDQNIKSSVVPYQPNIASQKNKAQFSQNRIQKQVIQANSKEAVKQNSQNKQTIQMKNNDQKLSKFQILDNNKNQNLIQNKTNFAPNQINIITQTKYQQQKFQKIDQKSKQFIPLQNNRKIQKTFQNQIAKNKGLQKHNQQIMRPQIRFSYDMQGNITQSNTLNQNLLKSTDNIYDNIYDVQYSHQNSNLKNKNQHNLTSNLLYIQKINNFQQPSMSRLNTENMSNSFIQNNNYHNQNNIYKSPEKQRKSLKLTSSIYSINQVLQVNSKRINNSQGVVDIIPFSHQNSQNIKKQAQIQNQKQNIKSNNLNFQRIKRLEQNQEQRYETNRLQHKFNDNNHEQDEVVNENLNFKKPFKHYQNYIQNKPAEIQSSFQSQSSRYHTIRKLIKNSQIQQQRYDLQHNEQRYNNSLKVNNKFYEVSPYVKIKSSYQKQNFQPHKHKINESFEDQIDNKVIQNAKLYLKANNYSSILGKKQKISQAQSKHKNLYRKYNSQQQNTRKIDFLNQKQQRSQENYQLTIKPPITPQQRDLDVSYSSFPLIVKTPGSKGSKKNIFSSKQKRELLQILKLQKTETQRKQ